MPVLRRDEREPQRQLPVQVTARPPQHARRVPPSVLLLVFALLGVAAGALAAAAVAVRAASHGSAPVPARSPAAYSLRWSCTDYPDGTPGSWGFGYSPRVVIRNTGYVTVPVEYVSVAELGAGSAVLASVDVGQTGWGAVWLAPGQSVTFADDHGETDPSWDVGCSVEHVALARS